MDDYIKREEALAAQNKSMNLNEMRERLKRLPAADVVEVVRCKDCKYWITNNYYHSCGLLNIVVNNGDFFCADGERKGGYE